jgi:hypothetical protein
LFANVGQQPGTGVVQCGFLTEHGCFVDCRLYVFCPLAFADGDDLVLHHRTCGAQIEQIDRTASEVGQITCQPPQRQGFGVAGYQYSEIQIAVGPRGSCTTLLYRTSDGLALDAT